MIFWRLLLTIWIGLSSSCYANPVTLEHTTATLLSSVQQIQPRKPFWVALKLDLKPNYYTYWINPGTTGKPMHLEWTLPTGFTASEIYWFPPHKHQTDAYTSFIYEKEAYYLVQITPPPTLPASSTLTCHASWLTCGEMCVPETTEISLTLPSSSGASPVQAEPSPLLQDILTKLPKKLALPGQYHLQDKHLIATISLPEEQVENLQSAQVFPYTQDLITITAPQQMRQEGKTLTFTIKTDLSSLPAKTSVLLQLTYQNGTIQFFTVDLILSASQLMPPEESSLGLILLFAFLGGFILNAMPCVFPILSIKALTIAKKKKSQLKKIHLQGLMYTAGVISSFLGLAFLLILLKKAGHSIGWGFQMQSLYFVTFIIYLTFLMGLSLSGVFYLPIFFGNANAAVEEARKRDSLLLGILAVLVATPCTAPFMGVAIGYALTQSAFIILIVFSALALGFALPYLVLCLFHPLLKVLPKPGAWMETFKQALAFPMYGTVLWLLWVVVQQGGSRALITIGAGLIIMAFCLWLWQKLRLQNPKAKIIVCSLFILSSISPLFYLTPSPIQQIIAVEPFSKSLLNKYIDNKAPVLVNVTASWCITCKYNEIILRNKGIQKYLGEKGAHYLEADWTNQSDEITHYLEEFNRSGVPLYVLYVPGKEPLVLPQLLTSEGLKMILEENLS